YTSVPVLDVVVAPALVRAHKGRTWWIREGGREAWLHQIRGTLAHCARHQNLVPAGTPGNKGRWTPYRGTMHQVRRFIEARGEVTLREIMEEVGTGHYANAASAKAAIPHALQWYESDWCVVEFRDGRNYYRITGTPAGRRVAAAAAEPDDIAELFTPALAAPGAFVLP
ncbi:MAG TPA: hypothetical protein VK358_18775, partial [Longimicrobium sp.]|nr:hypothetical protein [Longimicrobium sp.]